MDIALLHILHNLLGSVPTFPGSLNNVTVNKYTRNLNEYISARIPTRYLVHACKKTKYFVFGLY